MAIIAPSLLAANFLQLQEACTLVQNSEADWLHYDVMDGNFVPNISFGLPILEQIKTVFTKPIDVHLMIEKPERYINDFYKAGANIITVHAEACQHLHRTIQHIKSLGLQAGVALNPHTPISLIENIMADTDLFLLMSVNPGFGGQQFIPHTYKKIQQLAALLQQQNLSKYIEIDGGVTIENAPLLIQAGANVLVAGNTVFKNTQPHEIISRLKTF
jgi:ribulose-phosphate 3-epimerase